MKLGSLPIGLALAMALMLQGTANASSLPDGFVHLRLIAPEILQDMRYAGEDNFTARPVPGYLAAECIVARPVANALARVQASLASDGFSLVMLDCYRPKRAVRAFMNWAKEGGGPDARFHPSLPRSRLVPDGYIAARSTHSSGFAVDLTLARVSAGRQQVLDMGTPFDMFDPKSHTASRQVGPNARSHRQRLRKAMEGAGFVNYAREWWHYHFPGGTKAREGFDFPVTGLE